MEYNTQGAFNMLGQAIEEVFTKTADKEKQQINLAFLKSKIVQVWCDCSDNFIQDKLIKQYELKIK